MIFFEHQSVPPIRKQDVFLVVRAKLRVKGQQVFLFRRIVSLHE
jgi:hypothetical protein